MLIPVVLASANIVSDRGTFPNVFHIGEKCFLNQLKSHVLSLDSRYELEYSPVSA